MTSEQKFKEHHPKATIERQRSEGPAGKTYYLVRKQRRAQMWSGCGNTKTQAWADAVRSLQNKIKPEGKK